MESTGCNFTALPLPNSDRQQRRYPAHDPLLAHYSAVINGNQPDSAVISIQTPNNSIEQDRYPHLPPIQFTVDITGNLPEFTTTGDEQVLADNLPLTEFESPNNEIQLELTSMITDDPGSDTSIRSYSGPKKTAYLLGAYLAFLGLILLKLTKEGHVDCPTTNPFIIISVVAYAMAFLDLCILSWIDDLDNPDSSQQNFYLTCYRILKGAYYILCIVAFFSLLPVLLTPYHQPQSQP